MKLKTGEYLSVRFGRKTERRKIQYANKDRFLAESVGISLQRKHKARMVIAQVDGVWVVFRARNKA